MIKLYGFPFAVNARKVHWAIEELEIPYEYNFVDLTKGEHKDPTYLSLNPAGKVPVLIDGEITLPESNAIIAYLIDNYPHAKGAEKIVPKDKQGRARMWQWLFWQSSEGSTTLYRPFYQKFVLPLVTKQPFDEVAHHQALKETAAPLHRLDQELAHRAFLADNHFTIADVPAGEAVSHAMFGGTDISPYPHVRRWFEQLGVRPAFIKTRPKAPGA